MAYDWPTLSVNMDWESTIVREPKLVALDFGDGYVQRKGDGINNDGGIFTVIHKSMKRSDFEELRDFVREHFRNGDTIKIPTLPEDPTGATFGYYIITSSSISGDYAPNMTVILREVFADAE